MIRFASRPYPPYVTTLAVPANESQFQWQHTGDEVETQWFRLQGLVIDISAHMLMKEVDVFDVNMHDVFASTVSFKLSQCCPSPDLEEVIVLSTSTQAHTKYTTIH